jgi:hypothetical protein
MSLEVAARTGPASARVSAAEATYRYGAAPQAVRAFKEVLEMPNLDERTRRFVRCRLASLDFEQRFQAGDWMDLRPAEPEDPAWVNPFGKYRPLPEGDLEVQSGPEGHMIFSRARVGMEFEVRGEFEVVRSSSKSFQAGLVMGRPEFSSFDWYAFRVKRNDVEGDLAAFSSGWSTDQVYQKVRLNDDRNSFVFRFQRGAATVSVNGKEIMKNAKLPQGIRVEGNQFLLGVGAFNDMNDTVIRYHNLQVRKVGAN